MGLLSWLFPSEEDRIAKARAYLEKGRPADARYEVLDLDRDDAREVLKQSETSLAKLNLDAAVSWADAGDEIRVASCLELAEQFHHGGLEQEFRGARRRIREIRESEAAQEARKREEEEARLLGVDPLGLTGRRSLMDGAIPDLAGLDAEELEARLALILENYPDELRKHFQSGGGAFAAALIDFEDGRADLALPALLALADDNPAVCFERARCAWALGDPKAAIRAIREFHEHAGQHYQIGAFHTAELLARLQAETGDREGGLMTLREARRSSPQLGGPLFAQLLQLAGELEEAESVLRAEITRYPKAMQLYVLLAQVRVGGGQRPAAMQALETAMAQTCDTPGRCGYTPPDPAVVRMLAALYLEDGIEKERAGELLDKLAGLEAEPTWEDRYVEALYAKQASEPDATQMVEALWNATPMNDPRRRRLEQHLPA